MRGMKDLGHRAYDVAVVQAFTQEQVAKIVGLSRRQLDYWDRTEVISPSIAPFGGRGLGRLYSFTDLIKLKVGAEMRRRGFRPSKIRKTVRELEERGFDDPLLTVRFLAQPDGDEVLYVHPDASHPLSARAVDQMAEPMDLPLRDIRSGLEAIIADHMTRPVGEVRSLRNVQGSAPVVAGTRIPVEKIAALAADGWSESRIIDAFPGLAAADVAAALKYAQRRKTA